MRTFLCAAVALAVLSAGTAYGADEAKKKKKKNAAGLSGEIVKLDGAAGTVTVRVQLAKKSTEEKEYKVTDRTAVAEVKGDEKTELKAPKVEELFKKEPFKTGATVSLQTEDDGKTLKSLTFGPATPKKKKKNQ
jgi:hypothetical protein